MDRRAFVGSAFGSVALGFPAVAAGHEDDRPSFTITPDAPHRWRVRSWEWRDGAWRPRIAQMIRTGSEFRVHGSVAAADRTALAAWIDAQRSA